MSRPSSLARAAALLAAAALTGCPLPQAVPEYSKGTPANPPAILPSSVSPTDTVVKVSIRCLPPDEPRFTMKADLVDQNTTEPIEARWFVDYDPSNTMTRFYVSDAPVEIPQDATQTRRTVPSYEFAPYDIEKRGGYAPTVNTVHVVELVVANNGFLPEPSTGSNPLPYRTPLPGLDTQVFRWVFQYADVDCPPPPTPQ